MRSVALVLTGVGLGLCLTSAVVAGDVRGIVGVVIANVGVILYIYDRHKEARDATR